jgi:hypothetical protein
MFIKAQAKDNTQEIIELVLSVAESNEMCGISFEPIKDVELGFASDLRIVHEGQVLDKCTLPCMHSFSSLALLYSFCRRDMRCPLCRQGSLNVMDPDSLPDMIKESFKTQIQQETIADMREQEESDMTRAMEMSMDEIEHSITRFLENNDIYLHIHCFDDAQDVMETACSIEMSMLEHVEQDNTNDISFSMPRAELRVLDSILHVGTIPVDHEESVYFCV